MLKPSLLEQKRMQWAREQAEMQEWAPWGRPGGGAPPVKTTGCYMEDTMKRCSTSTSIRVDSLLPPLDRSEPKSGRRSRATSFYRLADPCALNDAEGETSGYHSENNGNALMADGKMMERKRWVPDAQASAPFPTHAGDAYVEVQAHQCQQQMLPQIPGRFQPPRWAERNTSAALRHEERNAAARPRAPAASDNGAVYYQQQGNYLQNFVNDVPYEGSERTAVSAVSSFLRGQNAPIDPAVLAERETKRRQATELQRALLEQLAEKERKKSEERERQRQEEQREEERLRRQLLMEQRQMEEERRRLEEKQIQEEKKVKAIHEAIVGAQEQALREKRSRRQFLEKREPSPCPPASHRSTTNFPVPAVPTIVSRQFVHTAVQTELEPVVHQCQCGRTSTRETKTNDESASETSRAGGKVQSTARQYTADARPMWGVNQPSRKYMTQSEKDPRCLKNRRDRMRRKQRALMEKQMHGSWPSSETSGSREDVYGYASSSSKNKTYYEFPRIPESRVAPVKEVEILDVQQPPVDIRSSSPPVPAVLKRLQNAAGNSGDKYDWDEFEKEDPEPKITKDMANMKIKDGRLSPASEMKKEDILFKLSLLRKGLEQRRSDAETMSTVSSVIY